MKLCALFLFFYLIGSTHAEAINEIDAHKIGMKIWHNECAGTIDGLTSWNNGEEFASLGIGHFIWYPKNKQGAYVEQFPELLRFFESQGVSIPQFLQNERHCPWPDKEAFTAAAKSQKMKELKDLLRQTIDLQVRFITKKLDETIDKILAKTAKNTLVKQHVGKLKQDPKGLYALIDYLNFKGAGLSPKESYQDKKWGLKQVLEMIPDNSVCPLNDFVASAKMLLKERGRNAPKERREERWLKGWFNRLDSYLK